jgi:chloride channel protein, CIC family
MSDHEVSRSSTTGGIPVAPSMGPALESAHVGRMRMVAGKRLLLLVGLSVPIAVAAGFVAQGLTRLIGLITNLSFYGRWSAAFISPAQHSLGAWVIAVPVCGGIIVGLMARFGSEAIRGHGIPEAMEQVLFNESRVPPRLTFLKPLSAAIAIGTGGPFGAEGPIIATGGALGSLCGQVMKTNPDERKTLLAAGAAAGMAATFGSPVSAVLLAIELLLFEYRARSFIPVALASTIAAGVRMAFSGSRPIFAMPQLAAPSGLAILGYIGLGAVIGVVAVWTTRAIYAIEDGFERLPVHWMWWPALGGIAVGVVGYFAPLTMGVGYDNIDNILGGAITGKALLMLLVLKFVSWSISLGSGTSGGTLAPLFTFGGAAGALLGGALASFLPALGMDPRMAALVGMAAIFAGASQALLASVVFAFETTLQPFGLLPLLGGCTMAYLVARLMMDTSIMTEKIARRGLPVSVDYSADMLASIHIRDAASPEVVCLRAEQTAEEVRHWLGSHQPGSAHTGFPVLNRQQRIVGVVTRKDLANEDIDPSTQLTEVMNRPPVVILETATVREALDLMVTKGIGRLPLVKVGQPGQVSGIVTRSDLLGIYGEHLHASRRLKRTINLGSFLLGQEARPRDG